MAILVDKNHWMNLFAFARIDQGGALKWDCLICDGDQRADGDKDRGPQVAQVLRRALGDALGDFHCERANLQEKYCGNACGLITRILEGVMDSTAPRTVAGAILAAREFAEEWNRPADEHAQRAKVVGLRIDSLKAWAKAVANRAQA